MRPSAALLCLLPTLALAAPRAQELTLPAFTGFAHPDANAVERHDDGTVANCQGELRFYVLLRQTGALQVELRTASQVAAAGLVVTCAAHPAGTACATADDDERAFAITTTGYHCLTVRTKDGSPIASLARLHLAGPAVANAHVSDVERRNAASVHLGYPLPKEHQQDIEWFYCEVTPRTDPLYTYYMAAGWQRGYFGMQVNSPTERRLIFSVWDAGNEGVDRDKVAADDRVTLVAKGEDVVASGFGHEGTGGHSHLVHDWQLGRTFRFLLHAAADGTHTTYTGWFWFDAEQRWGLIASFRAPKDGKLLRGLYSFNENFSGSNGDLLRDCEFGNAWARTTAGEWLPLTTARFTHDGHGDAQRLDRSAGVRGERFYLQNGGFLVPEVGAVTAARSTLTLPRPAGETPAAATLPTPPDARGSK